MAERAAAASGAVMRWLQLFALAGFAVAQPLFDLLGRNPEFFVARRSSWDEMLVVTAALLLVPPTGLWCVEELFGLVADSLRRAAHLLFVACLTGLVFVVPMARSDFLPDWGTLLVAGALGVAGAIAFARLTALRQFVSLAALGPVVFAGFFVSALPASPPAGEGVASATAPAARPTPIFLIVFDELALSSLQDASGGIDPGRYPAFARLVEGATFFPNASSVAFTTSIAVPAILTGRYPGPERSLPDAASHPQNLFALTESDHALNVVETLTTLRPSGAVAPGGLMERLEATGLDLSLVYAHLVLPPSLARGLPSIRENWGDFFDLADEGGDEPGRFRSKASIFEDFLEDVGPTLAEAGEGGASLHFAHVNLPHGPWSHLPSGRLYRPTKSYGMVLNRWSLEPWWSVDAYRRHLLQLEFTDHLLGRLLDRIAEEGVFDESLIIVVADHGVSLWPGTDRRNPIDHPHAEDILGVPLIVKTPGQTEGRIDSRFAETVDILPTIAQAIGLELPFEPDGCSLLRDDCPPRMSRTMYVFGEGEGTLRRLDFTPEIVSRQDTLERKLMLFGSGRERPDGLFWLRPYAGGIDVDLATADIAPEPIGRIRLRSAQRGRPLEAGSRLVRARIVAALELEEDPRSDPLVAVASGGRIQAIVPAPRLPGQDRWVSALLPESVAAAGFEDLAFFVVEEGILYRLEIVD